MNQSQILFLVGIGANAGLYAAFVEELRKAFPQANVSVLEWWQQPDFGMQSLQKALQDDKTFLIGHSAGGVVSLQALQRWPEAVERVVMLDSHQIHNTGKLPSIPKMLEIMLAMDVSEIRQQVEAAYAPVVLDDTQFYKAFTALVQWVNSDLEDVFLQIKKLGHRVLHVGFTDGNYKKLDGSGVQMEKELWGKFGIDIQCLPMNHFDLIEGRQAVVVCDAIKKWAITLSS